MRLLTVISLDGIVAAVVGFDSPGETVLLASISPNHWQSLTGNSLSIRFWRLLSGNALISSRIILPP